MIFTADMQKGVKMSDLIERQRAIELVRDICDAIMSGCGCHYDAEVDDEVFDDILEVDAILKCNKEIRTGLQQLPSAQPEDKCSECDAWNKYKNYPQEQRWIPVDIRNNSPEENEVILLGVRFRDDFKYFVTSRQDYNYWTGLGREIKGKLRWQPLPEPYQEEGE